MAIATDIGSIEVPRFDRGPETGKDFIPTPERISQYLELKLDEVRTQMSTEQGLSSLHDQLLVHEEDLLRDHPGFNPEQLKTKMELVAATLESNERYVKEIQSPQEKGMFQRAWQTLKSFPHDHPVVTALLAAAAIAGGIAAGLYAAGNMEMVLQSVGLGHLYGTEGAAAAAETMGSIVEGAEKTVPNLYEGPGGDNML